jgi:hypothetical protein
LNGYPIIKWRETTNPAAYSLATDETNGKINGKEVTEIKNGDETVATQFTNTLYCGAQNNTTARVEADVQLDANTTVTVGLDIVIPEIKPTDTVNKTKPYIDSDNFVLYRNGYITCSLKNYSETDTVLWKFDSLGSDLRYTYTDGGGGVHDVSKVGFETVTHDQTNNMAVYAEESRGTTVRVQANKLVDWNTEYRLRLQAVKESTGELLAETIVLVPRYDILFENESHYKEVKKNTYYDRSYFISYGFVEGIVQDDNGHVGDNNRGKYAYGALQAEKAIYSGTRVEEMNFDGKGDYIALTVGNIWTQDGQIYGEQNDMLILPVWNTENPDAVRYLMFVLK